MSNLFVIKERRCSAMAKCGGKKGKGGGGKKC